MSGGIDRCPVCGDDNYFDRVVYENHCDPDKGREFSCGLVHGLYDGGARLRPCGRRARTIRRQSGPRGLLPFAVEVVIIFIGSMAVGAIAGLMIL